MEDQEIFDLIKSDRQNFSILFDQYYVPIKKYILRRVGDYDVSCDIAAETFLKAFLKVSSFEYRGISYKVWLYRIATNEMNLYFRSRKYRPENRINLEEFNNEHFSNSISDEREVWEKEMQQNKDFSKVQKLIQIMPSHYGSVLALRYFERKSIKEIAEILNKPEGTIKSLCSRGLEKIRLELQRNQEL